MKNRKIELEMGTGFCMPSARLDAARAGDLTAWGTYRQACYLYQFFRYPYFCRLYICLG